MDGGVHRTVTRIVTSGSCTSTGTTGGCTSATTMPTTTTSSTRRIASQFLPVVYDSSSVALGEFVFGVAIEFFQLVNILPISSSFLASS